MNSRVDTNDKPHYLDMICSRCTTARFVLGFNRTNEKTFICAKCIDMANIEDKLKEVLEMVQAIRLP